jgi:serine/threonine protein kinase
MNYGVDMANLEGVLLGDYLLLECISHGAVADIYRASQNDTRGYEVAVKIFQSVYAEREAFRIYFMREAEKIGQFDHPHILPFLEYGEGEKLLYAITPFIKSGTLEDLLKKSGGKFSVMQTLPVVQQLCEAVQYAHEHDVIHGNLKPGNVFVTPDGRMLLADFGIVRGYADMQQSLARLDWDTTEYTAPEQSLGLLRRSSDIYALGTLFFRLLTGSPLFTGQTPVEVLLKHVRQPAPSARLLVGSIPEAVDAVLQKALSKHSDDRYATAAELSYAFTSATAVIPTTQLVPRSRSLTTRRLTSLLPDPLTPLPDPPQPSISLVDQTSVIRLAAELLTTASPTPQLPEQHGLAPLNPAEVDIAQMPTQAQEKLAAFVPHRSTEEFAHLRNQPLTPAPAIPPAARQEPGYVQRDEPEKNRLLLPILIVILLLIGLLGALISSLLFPQVPGSSGIRTSPTIVASRVSTTRLWRMEYL